MAYHMTPERKQELTAAIRKYVFECRRKVLERIQPREPMVCYRIAEPAPEPQAEEVRYSLKASVADHSTSDDIHELVERAEQEETFSQVLLRMIRERRLTEPEVYNAVFMDRRLFNKIRNTPEYQPNLRTALMLAIALRLNLEETKEFIGNAGFTLSPWRKFDVIIEYFIVNEIYDIFEINEMLAAFDLPPLLKCE